MPMYNLIEYSDNYAKTTGSLWQYCKDIPARNANDDIVIFSGDNTTDSFKFKAKITGQTGNDGTKDLEIMVPLKYLSNFWRTLEMPLINCEVNFILTWSSRCALIATAYKMTAVDLSKQQALDADPRAIQQINFTANLDRAGNTRVYFILEEAKETILNFSQGIVKVL